MLNFYPPRSSFLLYFRFSAYLCARKMLAMICPHQKQHVQDKLFKGLCFYSGLQIKIIIIHTVCT